MNYDKNYQFPRKTLAYLTFFNNQIFGRVIDSIRNSFFVQAISITNLLVGAAYYYDLMPFRAIIIFSALSATFFALDQFMQWDNPKTNPLRLN